MTNIFDDPPDTNDVKQSFAVPSALRAPVGTARADVEMAWVKAAARRLAIGLLLLLVDIRVDGFDVVPDTLGALAVLAGASATIPLARLVGPSRAGARALALAVLHLFLVVANDLPASLTGLSQLELDLLGVAQTVVALVGTAVVATVLARSHDALDQLGRRDRWGATRRWSLVLAGFWLVFATLAAYHERDSGGVIGFAVGVGSVAILAMGIAVLFLLGRALAASMNVDLRVGFGED